ncbi:hypothetical protein MJH12_07975 [bacterium]|nr:hypothetical protein [bacterium]
MCLGIERIYSSLFLKKWMSKQIGLPLKESHQLYFADKNEKDKLDRENELSYRLKVVSALIDLEETGSLSKLLVLDFELWKEDRCIYWKPNLKNTLFIDLFLSFLSESCYDAKSVIFRMKTI